MLRRPCLAAVLTLFAACTVGGSESAQTTQSSTSASRRQPTEADQALVERAYAIVTRSQLAGFVERDLEAYMEPWAPNAKFIFGRDRKSSPHDLVLDREQLRASKASRFAAMPAGLTMQHTLVDSEVGDGVVTLLVETQTRGDYGVEVVAETFTLALEDGQLRILENRAWPLSSKFDGQRTEFNPEFWAEHDAKVTLLIEIGELREAARLCSQHLDLARWRALAEQVAEQPDADAIAWAELAWARLAAGAVAEAKAAALEARSLDPQISLPLAD